MDEKNKQTKYVSFNLDARLYYVVDILGHSSQRLKSHPLNRWSEMKPGQFIRTANVNNIERIAIGNQLDLNKIRRQGCTPIAMYMII